MPLPEQLARQIVRAASRSISELDAQRIVIEPLLAWLGFDIYDLDQVATQVAVAGAGRGQGEGRIDYLISVEGHPYLLIEAKKPQTNLKMLSEDKPAIQQIHAYCHAHKAHPRWGVLTNGWIWIIYDTQANCDVFERSILTINIQADIEMLKAISPACRERLTRFADELNDARAVPNMGIRQRAIRDIEREYKELFSAPGAAAPPAPHAPAQPAADPAPAAVPPPVHPGASTADHLRAPESGAKPIRLSLPDGRRDVKTWTAVLVETANYLIRKNLLRTDFKFSWTKRILISNENTNNMIKPIKLLNGWKIETNWSAAHCVKISGELLKACGEDPAGFSVEYV